MLNLRGKAALVTGCGTLGGGWGNGRAIAVQLARQGATVYGCDIELDSAAETLKTIESEGGVGKVVECDVTNPSQVAAMIADCIKTYGRLDIVVNNVGRSEPGDPVSMDFDTWNKQLAINVSSAFLICKHALPTMIEQRSGSIINISSVAGLRYIGKPQVAYAAAKAALMQLTATTAVIHAGSGVRVNSVVPGLMFTPLVKRLADKYAEGKYDEFVARRQQQVPMGHMGDAFDVANAVVFLASDESRYITGQQLIVDGGLTATTP